MMLVTATHAVLLNRHLSTEQKVMHDTLTIFSLLTTIGVCFLSCLHFYTLVHVGFIACNIDPDQTAPSEAVLRVHRICCVTLVWSAFNIYLGAQWLSDRVLDSRPRGCGFKPHRRHRVVSLSKSINPSLVLVQPRKTRPFITERLLMGRKNQTNKQKHSIYTADH